jgi:hypothetical protein
MPAECTMGGGGEARDEFSKEVCSAREGGRRGVGSGGGDVMDVERSGGVMGLEEEAMAMAGGEAKGTYEGCKGGLSPAALLRLRMGVRGSGGGVTSCCNCVAV